MAVQDLTEDVAGRLDYRGLTGALVVAVQDDSLADAAEIGASMLIQEVNRQPVRDLSGFKTAMEQAIKKPPILLLVNNQGSYRYAVIASSEDNQP